MVNRTTKSQKSLINMLIILIVVFGSLAAASLWKYELVTEIYFIDDKTIILNGIIFLLFFMGVIHLVRSFVHYSFEEKQIKTFVSDKELGNEDFIENISTESIIAKRYFTVKDLYDRQVPIHHGAISSIMIAEESLYQSFPKFVNNVLILTGVFGTIVSLIFALVGASSILQTALPGAGMGVMLSGMNTALTTTATAIVCYFVFTYFFQRLTDVQTYVFGKVEEAVLIHIVPEFAFDSEAVTYKTELLIKEMRELVEELKKGTGFIQNSLAGLNEYNQIYIEKMAALITGHEYQITKTEHVVTKLEAIKEVLLNGFRLKD
ncbi:MAG: hypothetical protein JSU83_16125 [Deltaproteobacteria bacterium]|nr:MAG: hypothetical protein JSU83_16125 [Deltaproteobacteria bacterium]